MNMGNMVNLSSSISAQLYEFSYIADWIGIFQESDGADIYLLQIPVQKSHNRSRLLTSVKVSVRLGSATIIKHIQFGVLYLVQQMDTCYHWLVSDWERCLPSYNREPEIMTIVHVTFAQIFQIRLQRQMYLQVQHALWEPASTNRASNCAAGIFKLHLWCCLSCNFVTRRCLSQIHNIVWWAQIHI